MSLASQARDIGSNPVRATDYHNLNKGEKMPNKENMTNEQLIRHSRATLKYFFNNAISQMPECITVKNTPDGVRTEKVVDITPTLTTLEQIADRIFSRNTNKHYLGQSLENPKQISYAKEPDHKFDARRRTRTTLHKYITTFFPQYTPEQLSQLGLEKFCERMKALAAEDIDNYFQIISGVQIGDAYSASIGGTSCMRGADSGKTHLYWVNQDVCKMLRYTDDSIEARALLWIATTTNTGKQVSICDRIYPNSGTHIEMYKRYCAKHGILMRHSQGYPPSGLDYTTKEYEHVRINQHCSIDGWVKATNQQYQVVVTDPHSNEGYPYIDTMSWGKRIDGNTFLLTNKPQGFRATKYFQCTCGGIQTFEDRICYQCQEITDGNEDTYSRWENRLYCNKCFQKAFTTCWLCRQDKPTTRTRIVTINEGEETQDHHRMCLACLGRYARLWPTCNIYFTTTRHLERYNTEQRRLKTYHILPEHILDYEGEEGSPRHTRICQQCWSNHPAFVRALINNS